MCKTTVAHATDADCSPFLNVDGLCTECGVYRNDEPCPFCGGWSFHAGECIELLPAEEIAEWPPLAPHLAEKRARMISLGSIDPTCSECAELMRNPDAFCPDHKASNGCESGSRPHCTCDACF